MVEIYNTDSNYVEETDADDFMVNYNPDTIFYAYRGNDHVMNYAEGSFSAKGGAGNDTIINYAANGNSELDGQWGNDLIVNYVSNSLVVSLVGGYGNDTLVNYGSGMATLDAMEVGDKVLVGGSGIDVFMIDIENENVIWNYDSNDWICLKNIIHDIEIWGEDVLVKDANLYTKTVIKGAAGKNLNFYYTGVLSDNPNEENFKRTVAEYEDMVNAAIYSAEFQNAINISNIDKDSIYGTAFDDTISNYNDDSYIRGLGGNDMISNFAEYAMAYGGMGNDTLENFSESEDGGYYYGGWGNDILVNHFSADANLYGEGNEDLIINYASNDTASNSSIKLDGGNGNDTLMNYGFGEATLQGDDGDDLIINYASGASMTGDRFYLSGGKGNDTIINNSCGMATLNGGEGDDILIGGNGVDVFVVDLSDGHKVIANYDSNDLIYAEMLYSASFYKTEIVGNDVVIFAEYDHEDYQSTLTIKDAADKTLNFFPSDVKDALAEFIAAREEILGTYPEQSILLPATDYRGGDEDMLIAEEIEIDNIARNNRIFNVNKDDTIFFTTATLSDLISTDIGDTAIDLIFNTNESTHVTTTDNISPAFKFSNGESYIYDRGNALWQRV